MTPIHTKIPIFPWTPLLIHVRRHLGEPFRKFSAKIMTKFKVILQKLPKSAKNVKKLHIQDHKIQNFEFSHRYHYSYTLEDTQENIFRSFQPKLMTKFEVIRQKPSKNWIFGQNGHFLSLFGPKSPQFRIFPRVPLLTHASRHLGDNFRKLSATTNDKN